KTQRTHISPHLLDIRQAFCLRPTLTPISPTERIFPILRPDRILLLVIDYYLVHSCVFSVFSRHKTSCNCELTFGVFIILERVPASKYSPPPEGAPVMNCAIAFARVKALLLVLEGSRANMPVCLFLAANLGHNQAKPPRSGHHCEIVSRVY